MAEIISDDEDDRWRAAGEDAVPCQIGLDPLSLHAAVPPHSRHLETGSFDGL
jgi:hypothetical protein